MKFLLIILALILLLYSPYSFALPLADDVLNKDGTEGKSKEELEPIEENRHRREIKLAPSKAKCEDETWTSAQQGQESLCFKAALFPKVPTSFAEGKSLCQCMGAFPSPFRGENDRLAIQLAINKTNHRKGADFYSGYFIGIRNNAPTRAGPDDFRLERDSSPITYSTWTPHQPDKLDRGPLGWEQCVTVLDNDKLNWNDIHCEGFNDLIYDIICAKNPTNSASKNMKHKTYETCVATGKNPVEPPVEQKPVVPPVAALETKLNKPKESICDDKTWINAKQGEENLCFKAVLFQKRPSTYAEGKSICESKFGGFAAPIRGENDQMAIKSAVDKSNYKKNEREWLGFYVGIRNHATTRSSPNDFRFERDSSPISYSTWTKDMPDKRDHGPPLGMEQCVEVMLNDNLNWNDVPCKGYYEDLVGIICAKKPAFRDEEKPPIKQKEKKQDHDCK